jgi:hypothetical protein
MPTNSNGTHKGAAAAISNPTELRIWILTIKGRSRCYLWEVSAQRAYYRERGRGNIAKQETALLVEHDPAVRSEPEAWLVTVGWCNCGGSERHAYLDHQDAADAVAADAERQAAAGRSVAEAPVTPFIVTERKAWRWRS